MWTHGTDASSSNRDRFDGGEVGTPPRAWWQLLPTRTADPGRPARERGRVPTVIAAPRATGQHTLLTVALPADVLGTQIDGVFELHDGTPA